MDDKISQSQVIVVPHTHWDREWYLPFQVFRNRIVHLVDYLLKIFETQPEYYFMLDGQTIIIKDYLELRPKNSEKLFSLIKSGQIDVGPLFILPDEWLVSGESIIRNYEYSFQLGKKYNIPIMSIAYLPDMFGHSQAIPQILYDTTNIRTAVLWRGVGAEISMVPFIWKTSSESQASIFTIYLPQGYGNASRLPEDKENLKKAIQEKLLLLKPYSPVPIYLLMNGTDHTFPQPKLQKLLNELSDNFQVIKIGTIAEFIELLRKGLVEEDIQIYHYFGEFRSSLRAPLLQDTYSSRMWIKQLSQKINDLLVHYAEPLNTYLNELTQDYPSDTFLTAWKWYLENQPHDSICGCSIDQVHKEMKTRFDWSKQIGENLIEDFYDKLTVFVQKIDNRTQLTHGNTLIVFNPTNMRDEMIIETSFPKDFAVTYVEAQNGNKYPVQQVFEQEDILFQSNVNTIIFKSLLSKVSSGKVYNYYINDVATFTKDPQTLQIIVKCSEVKIYNNLEEKYGFIKDILKENQYKRFHILVIKGGANKLIFTAPLKPWAFTVFTAMSFKEKLNNSSEFIVTNKNVENKFYKLEIKKNGSFDLYDKQTDILFQNLHQFEDWGDKGDEYTFGRIGPVINTISIEKKSITQTGNVFAEILLSGSMLLPKELSKTRDKRQDKVKIPLKIVLRIYKNLPRIDFETTLTNVAKDHRLRINFLLPFKSDNTLTSTHFGVVKRKTILPDSKEYIEKPSGIQPQKRFIRIENPYGIEALTLVNDGLPEVELIDQKILSLTLLRAIGYLSRDDFEERPLHAGPFLETKEAQEQKTYTFQYSLIVHPKTFPLSWSADQAESATLAPWVRSVNSAVQSIEKLNPLCEIHDNDIRFSSIRVRNKTPLITLFNLTNEKKSVKAIFPMYYKNLIQTTVEEVQKEKFKLESGQITLEFFPHEIKMLELLK
ncbi:glycoside hydrolase family 38 N-terminal domain-containing protein [Candidatus Hodarchaeum mangrovi]